MQTADASWAGMVPIAANHHGLLFRNAFVGLIGVLTLLAGCQSGEQQQAPTEPPAVQTAQANIENAQLNVDYTQVVAPIARRIDLSAFDVGNLIGPESGVLANINRMDPIKVAFAIAETWYLELVQEGVEVRRRGRTRAAPTYWWWTPRTRWSRAASALVSASARIWSSKRG